MANDFDQFPLYDPLTKRDSSHLSDTWRDFLSFFYEVLISYLNSTGVFLPQLTTAERDKIASPQNGQMIYNSTLNSAQYWKNGVWSSF